jgi:hypothetical protein
MLPRDNALLKEIGEILDQESKTTDLENMNRKLKHAIDAMEVSKQSVEQIVIESEKERQSIQ